MRKLFGVGTSSRLHGALAASIAFVIEWLAAIARLLPRSRDGVMYLSNVTPRR
jgi:hypothetical protein